MEYFLDIINIVISSNSILAIMKRNRNGISLFLKWKIAFFETENHWPYMRCSLLVQVRLVMKSFNYKLQRDIR